MMGRPRSTLWLNMSAMKAMVTARPANRERPGALGGMPRILLQDGGDLERLGSGRNGKSEKDPRQEVHGS